MSQLTNKILITSYGGVWAITRSQFKKMLAEVLKGKEVDYNNFGTQIGNISYNLTDLDSEVANNILEDLRTP